MVVRGGKLSNYGIKEAQQYLRKWPKDFAPKKSEMKESTREILNKKIDNQASDAASVKQE